jgi:hypothetical protein
MKVVIAGSRDITDYDLVEQAIVESGFEITEVVSGTARGVDTLGEQWAMNHATPIKRFPALWDKYQKAAGFIRNRQMACYAEALVAITIGSPGTKNMIEIARKMGLKVYVKEVTKNDTR